MPRTLSKEVTHVPTIRTPRLCTLGLGLHFLRGLRSRFTGGGSTSEGSSGKGLVSFSVLTTGKVKVAEPGLMGMYPSGEQSEPGAEGEVLGRMGT